LRCDPLEFVPNRYFVCRNACLHVSRLSPTPESRNVYPGADRTQPGHLPIVCRISMMISRFMQH
jgi:hypothetical protein